MDEKIEETTIGRPRIFATPEAMEAVIQSYYATCQETGEPLTVEGLCDELDMGRAALLNYEKKPGYELFFDTVTRAKRRIQRDMVTRALGNKSNNVVSVFLLKANYGYEDRSVVEMKEEKILRGLTKEQIAEILTDEP